MTTTTTTPTSGAADLLDLIEAYAEARHRQGHSSYNAQTATALQAVKDALAAGQATAAQAVVPAEWPTNGMIDAGRKAAASQGRLLGSGQSLWHVFRAMLAAAPAQPAAQQPHRSGCTAGTDEECVQRGCGTNCPAVSPRQGVAYAALPDEREAFERWNKDKNQGYDLAPCNSGKMQTFESIETEHAWRGFFHALRASHGQAPALTNLNCKSEQKRLATLWGFVPAQAASVQEDALRYRWLREGNDAKHGAAWHVAVNLYGGEWDAAIDAAMNKGATT